MFISKRNVHLDIDRLTDSDRTGQKQKATVVDIYYFNFSFLYVDTLASREIIVLLHDHIKIASIRENLLR